MAVVVSCGGILVYILQRSSQRGKAGHCHLSIFIHNMVYFELGRLPKFTPSRPAGYLKWGELWDHWHQSLYVSPLGSPRINHTARYYERFMRRTPRALTYLTKLSVVEGTHVMDEWVVVFLTIPAATYQNLFACTPMMFVHIHVVVIF